MARPKKYPDELIARGVRLALESERPIAHIAADLGMHPETLRKKVRQAEADSGARPELEPGRYTKVTISMMVLTIGIDGGHDLRVGQFAGGPAGASKRQGPGTTPG